MKLTIWIMTMLLLASSIVLACDGDDEETSSPATTGTPAPTAGIELTEEPQAGIPHVPVPQHPFLAPNGKSSMHNDAYMTDTYEISGPLNNNPDIIYQSYANGPNTCATISFDSQNRILSTSAAMLGFTIVMIDPETLDIMASYPLPPRDHKDPLFPYGDTSGATYFVLDHQDHILFTDPENAIQIIKYSDEKGEFEQVQRYDLSEYVVPMELPARDHVQMTIPDWENEYLWFTTRYGIVGAINRDTGEVETIELEGEELENSFAVGEDGVYILSDYAMYRFSEDESGFPVIDWRTKYDRGTRIKPSNFNQGSGTTPQLFGDMVAIGDNAEPLMNILFLKRSDGNEVCRIPVFDEGISTTENALPGLVREGPNGLEYSVIVDNNYGILRDNIMLPYGSWKDHEGGLCRIDLIPDGNGGYTCKQIWRNSVESSNVLPKLSLPDGLLYVYTYEKVQDNEYDYDWFLTTVEFETGEVAFNIPTGRGAEYANFGQPLSIGPDGGAYLGTMRGLICVRDTTVQ